MVDYYIGTMGFAYKDWAGVFYPMGLTARDYLSYYSGIFNAVEIDSTFYGTPRRETVARWRDSTPNGFKICVKVPRVITHVAGLVNVNLEITEFIDHLLPLGEKLGVILVQLPPSFAVSNLNQIKSFLENLPANLQFAVEFRHSSWYTQQTAEILAKHDICWVATEFHRVPKEVELTSDLIFIRLIGRHGRFRSHDLEQIDVTQQLDRWWQWIRSLSDALQAVYIFLNDDFSGHAPASANRLKKMIGLPIEGSDLPKQMKLF